ncbi:hypothetical protein [Pseudomonas fluorescens]|uniref:hypothetical protein n=1 Tax=Pseudomonas fluorescens TaxID=294 RepID=UPI0012499E68|nr:hypothetical protein [Pseudomonas fluorescens]CAG8872372.1 hypothetical protein PS861_04885 [Pseudomonas fluorescens]
MSDNMGWPTLAVILAAGHAHVFAAAQGFFPICAPMELETILAIEAYTGETGRCNGYALALNALYGCKAGRVAWKGTRCSSSLRATC